MKLSKVLICALCIALGVSCSKNPDDPKGKEDEKGTEMTFEANWSAPAWKAGDAVFFSDGTSGKKVSLTQGGMLVSFKVKADENAKSYLIYYPYSENVQAVSGTVVKDLLASEQTAAEGAYPLEGIKAVASTSGPSFTMSGIFGYLKFKVEEEGYDTFTVTGKDSEILAGDITVSCDGQIPSVTATGAVKTVTLKAAGGFTPGKWYFVAVVPQRLKSGVTCALSAEGKESRTLNVTESLSAGIGQEAELGTFKAPQPAVDYYKIDLKDFTWSATNVFDVKNKSGEKVALLTKEYFGATVKAQGIVVYPVVSGKADYTKGCVVQVTKKDDTDLGDEPQAIHGGTLSITDMNPANVVYNEGKTNCTHEAYVKSDGSEVTSQAPDFINILEVEIEPVVLKTDVKDHPVAKLGTQIWLASDLATTKFSDGTSIPKAANGDAIWADGAPVFVIHNNGQADYYMYNGYALGYTDGVDAGTPATLRDRISPEGWRLPTDEEYVGKKGADDNYSGGICGFCGYNLETMKNLSLLRAANTYKVTPSSGKAKVGSLGYTSTWTSAPDPGSNNKAMLGGLKGDGTKVDAPQALKNAFAVRLIKE